MEPSTASVFVSPGIFDLCALEFVPLRCLGLQGRSPCAIFFVYGSIPSSSSISTLHFMKLRTP